MSRFRLFPSRAQAERMLTHCAHARYVWNLAVEQHAHWRRWRQSAPGFVEQCRQLVEQPGQNVAQKSGLNRAILAQGWGLLRQRTGHKAPGRVEDVPAPYTSLRCSACGWIDKNSRKSQAEFVCSSCGFTCNADTNAASNVAAGQGGIPRPRRTAGAGGTTPPNQRSSVREPQPEWAGIPLF